MAEKTFLRRAIRHTRPDSERFFTLMLVLSHRTIRWSLSRKTLKWTLWIVAGVYGVAMIGSAYGLWATKRLMSFSQLQKETAEQQRQLRESQEQAEGLGQEIQTLKSQMDELLRSLGPTPSSPLPSLPDTGAKKEGLEKLSLLRSHLDEAMTNAKAIQARMAPVFHIWNHTPSIPPTAGYVSSPFGLRVTPFTRSNDADSGPLSYHKGLDITNSEGTPVQATAAGRVVTTGWQAQYGNHVVIQHSGEFETLYAHLSRILVSEGMTVNRGDLIGAMGRSGNATGVHLHYEVRRFSNTVNPAPYLKLQKQFLTQKTRTFLPFRG